MQMILRVNMFMPPKLWFRVEILQFTNLSDLYLADLQFHEHHEMPNWSRATSVHFAVVSPFAWHWLVFRVLGVAISISPPIVCD